MVVLADGLPPPPSTWVALKPLPHQGRSAIFALAVDPANNQVLIAGNSEGSLLRSVDGAATWASVHSGKVVVTSIVFSAFKPGLVLGGRAEAERSSAGTMGRRGLPPPASRAGSSTLSGSP